MVGRMLMGAAAGTAAAIPMTAYWEYLHARLPGEPPRPLPPREIVEAIAVKAGISRHLSEVDVQNLALAAHFGYAAATGALFGAVAPRRPSVRVGAGVLFGLGVWTASYLGWLPAAGVHQHPRHDPPARTGLMIGGHLVWGAALGLVMALGRSRRVRASTRGRALA
jgi:uncharacterized membrane protein YagU involved in acid resistance